MLWEDGKRALALRWVGAEPGTAGYLGSLAVDRAQNWKEFEAAMPRWKVPSENIVYADRAGNIGEHSTGLAPLRKNLDWAAAGARPRGLRVVWICAQRQTAAPITIRARDSSPPRITR